MISHRPATDYQLPPTRLNLIQPVMLLTRFRTPDLTPRDPCSCSPRGLEGLTRPWCVDHEEGLQAQAQVQAQEDEDEEEVGASLGGQTSLSSTLALLGCSVNCVPFCPP